MKKLKLMLLTTALLAIISTGSIGAQRGHINSGIHSIGSDQTPILLAKRGGGSHAGGGHRHAGRGGRHHFRGGGHHSRGGGHFGRHRSHIGIGIGIGGGYGGYYNRGYYGGGYYGPYYNRGYYGPNFYGYNGYGGYGYGGYYPTAVAVPSAPPVYIQQETVQPVQPQTNYWHYCRKPEGYYPYVKQCPDGWLQVAPQPIQ
tara:strand:- start:461 stop:1060 length:600 start_codon:yes stop_codon:yes gene_type:complete